ncbi:MAG: inositol monophosphatase [Actinomycetota bacterium]
MDELELAKQLGAMGAEIAMKHFSHDPAVRVKKDGTLVTIADTEIEAAIRKRIAEVFSSHAILGEEEGLMGDPSAPTWIIDPIDGTNNYAWGIPVFATLVALRVEGRTIVGVADAPALNEIYDAARGNGARMNGKPIQVSQVETLAESRFCYGSRSGWEHESAADAWWSMVDRAKRDRGFGDFWGHMLVARGAAEVMAEPNLNPWDVMALEVIVEEAGGRLTGFAGQAYPDPLINAPKGDKSCLSTNGSIHAEVVQKLSLDRRR